MAESQRRHLLHVFPSFAIGGSQSRFAQLVRLHGERYRHTVVAIDGVLTMAQRLPQGAPVECVQDQFLTALPIRGTLLASRIFARYRPDMLVTYNWGTMDWCVARRFQPDLGHVHLEDGFGPEEQQHQLWRRGFMRRLTLGDARTVTVVPSRKLEDIAKKIWHLPPRSLRYIPNGIDCRRFATDRAPGPETGPVVIGTVAALRPEKNLTRLIGLFCEAAARRPPGRLSLVIVGDGPERELLQKAAARSAFADKIVFAGATSEPERFLAEMDIFALTSDTEQMPFSVIEAMAAGLPIVSFHVGDVPSMVAQQNAAMASVPIRSDEGFIEHVLDIADHAQLRRQIGEANRVKAAALFDENAMAAAYAELFG